MRSSSHTSPRACPFSFLPSASWSMDQDHALTRLLYLFWWISANPLSAAPRRGEANRDRELQPLARACTSSSQRKTGSSKITSGTQRGSPFVCSKGALPCRVRVGVEMCMRSWELSLQRVSFATALYVNNEIPRARRALSTKLPFASATRHRVSYRFPPVPPCRRLTTHEDFALQNSTRRNPRTTYVWDDAASSTRLDIMVDRLPEDVATKMPACALPQQHC